MTLPFCLPSPVSGAALLLSRASTSFPSHTAWISGIYVAPTCEERLAAKNGLSFLKHQSS